MIPYLKSFQQSIGLDIGVRSIKIVVLRRWLNKVQIVKYGEEKVDPSSDAKNSTRLALNALLVNC